jgi:hypothetical protein
MALKWSDVRFAKAKLAQKLLLGQGRRRPFWVTKQVLLLL